jgi:hypothetical protein
VISGDGTEAVVAGLRVIRKRIGLPQRLPRRGHLGNRLVHRVSSPLPLYSFNKRTLLAAGLQGVFE